mmetsp:Transcript_44656/g.95037  ORF Transcript_44656/g.95037 Transcript_44656/m.95037 type:complete len:1053 (-) Transcript_44656:140-3298(-)
MNLKIPLLAEGGSSPRLPPPPSPSPSHSLFRTPATEREKNVSSPTSAKTISACISLDTQIFLTGQRMHPPRGSVTLKLKEGANLAATVGQNVSSTGIIAFTRKSKAIDEYKLTSTGTSPRCQKTPVPFSNFNSEAVAGRKHWPSRTVSPLFKNRLFLNHSSASGTTALKDDYSCATSPSFAPTKSRVAVGLKPSPSRHYTTYFPAGNSNPPNEALSLEYSYQELCKSSPQTSLNFASSKSKAVTGLKLKLKVLSPLFSHTTYFPAQILNPSDSAVWPKSECRPAKAARLASTANITSSPPTSSASVGAGNRPPILPSIMSRKVPNHTNNTVSTVKKPMSVHSYSTSPTATKPILYVGITLERSETAKSWGFVFTQDAREHALIVRVAPPSKVYGPKVKWCQVTISAPNPSTVYRANASIVPLERYEPSLIQNFPPPFEGKGPWDAGLLVPYINPGDAIIAINGIPISAFTTLENFASYIRQNCQHRMTIVAMRHEHVWRAALDAMFAGPGGQEQEKEWGSVGNNQAMTDHIVKSVKGAWKAVLFSRGGNHQMKRKVSSHNAAPNKRSKIHALVYANDLFRDESGKPILYCDNNDFDIEDGKRIHYFVNDEIKKSFHQWRKKRKASWVERRKRKDISHTAEDAIDDENEGLTVQFEFWLVNGHESFDQWLSAVKIKWMRSYSWHRERREALQWECEKEVHFPLVATTIESQALLNQFGHWLSARKQQVNFLYLVYIHFSFSILRALFQKWRLERRKRQRHRVELPGTLTEDENRCSLTGASSSDCIVNNDATNSNNQYFDEILADEEVRLTRETRSKPMDISWVFDSQHGAPDDIIVNIMTYLLPSDHGNLLCLSFGSNFLFKQRNDMWKTLCPKHWILPRRPRKSWCVMYITKIRAEEETSRKRSDDLLVKANVIIEKGDQLNKLDKLVRKAERDFEFSVNYISGVVLERNSLTNIAVIAKRHKIIKWLIEEKGADVETCDRGQFTPLMNAAWNGDKHMVRYLLGKGCDRTKVGYNHSSQGLAPTTFKGLCAEGWARKRGHDEVAELIRFGL